MDKKIPKENIFNVPNFITFSRIIISFVVLYFIFGGFNIFYIILAFVIGMLTDAADGQIARRFKLTTEFGRKFDMVADRFLLLTTVLAILIKFGVQEMITRGQVSQIFLIISREIINLPFLVMIFMFFGKKIPIPQVRFIGKTTTVMQAIALPLILLDITYGTYNISLYFAVATGIIGAISALYYIRDTKNLTS